MSFPKNIINNTCNYSYCLKKLKLKLFKSYITLPMSKNKLIEFFILYIENKIL